MVSGELNTVINYDLYADVDTARVIKVTRLRRLGHLIRMEENSPCKNISFSQPEGYREKGKTRIKVA
jgi:hypothetical protein